MKHKTSTKRTLALSLLVMLLCVAMLVGTTFAWFTDSASTAVNKIQAGTLDVQLLDEQGNSLEGQTLTWKKAQGAPAGEQILWEPGCTYNLQPITIKNNGNLALKYKIQITGIQGDAELNNAIEWTITNTSATTALDADHSLAARASDTLTISGHMKEEAGNEYQGKYIDNIAITVVATQDTVEFDSIDNQYDADAQYPIVASALVSATADTVIQDQNNTIKVTAPIGSLATSVQKLSVLVEKVAEPSTVTVTDEQDAQTYEISLKDQNGAKVETQSGKLFTIELNVGQNRTGLKLYHSGVEMTNDGGTLTDAADHYIYNSATGIITMKVNSFSPFTVVFDSFVSVKTLEDLASYDSNIGDYANKTSGTYKFQNDLEVSKRVMFAEDVVIDLNGHTLKINTTRWGNYPGTSPEITIKNGRVEVVYSGGYFWHVRSDDVVINLENVQIDTTKGYAAFGAYTNSGVISQKLTINADEKTSITGDFLFAAHSFNGNAETPSVTNIVVNGVHASNGTSKHSVVLNATKSNVKINAEFNNCVIDCQANNPIYCQGNANNGAVSLTMNDCKLIAHNSGIYNAIFTNNTNCSVTLDNCIDKDGNSLTIE